MTAEALNQSQTKTTQIAVHSVRALVVRVGEHGPEFLVGKTSLSTKNPQKRGLLELLGGKPDEPLEYKVPDFSVLVETARRETAEEANVHIKPVLTPVRFLDEEAAWLPGSPYNGSRKVGHVVLAEAISGIPTPSGEHSWVGFVPAPEVLSGVDQGLYRPDTVHALSAVAKHQYKALAGLVGHDLADKMRKLAV